MAKNQLSRLRPPALKHGAYSRSLVVDGADDLSTRGEIIQALQYRAAKAITMCEIIGAHIAAKVQDGADLDSVPSVKALAAYQNSATRMLTALYAMLPADDKTIDISGFEVSGEDQVTDRERE